MTRTHREYVKRQIMLDLLHTLLVIISLLIVYLFITSSKYLITASSTLAFLVLMRISFGLLEDFQKNIINVQKINEKTWGMGDMGEKKTSENLNELSSEYKVINDIQTGSGNIDHLVVGPTGLFVIETKSNHGTVAFHNNSLYINTKKSGLDFINQTYAEKAWLSEKLFSASGKKFTIIPILAFPFAHVDTRSINCPIKGVWVSQGSFANELIKHNPGFLSSDEVKNIIALLYAITKA